MADDVNARTLVSEQNRIVRLIYSVSDGTGESGVTKVDISSFTAQDGAAPVALDVRRIYGSVRGMSVQLDWNHSTNDEIIALTPGDYDFNFAKDWGVYRDPQTDSTGDAANGDILLTTIDHSDGDGYCLVLELQPRPAG